MEKMNKFGMDIAEENISKLKNLFPECFIEGKIDFDILKKCLGCFVDSTENKFSFSWNGKIDTIKMSQKPSLSTLVPCVEKSKNWGDTNNIYIEGDNLEVLKTLTKTYFGKIKIIYIDPPYNTGNDFVYHDDFSKNSESYLNSSNQALKANPETSGRFHTDWLNMMYSRIAVSQKLLTDDGVMFISIGQKELSNLVLLCDEIFSENNRVGIISRMMKSGGNKGQYFSPNIEYVLVYAKNIDSLEYFREPLSDDLIEKVYNQVETTGPRQGQKYRTMGLYQAGLDCRPNQRYWIECPDGTFVIPSGKTFPENVYNASKVLPVDGDGVWRWSSDRFLKELAEGNILFKETSTSSLLDENGKKSKWNIYTKIWLDDRLEEGRVPVDLITKWENRISSQELKELDIPFDFAKPTELIQYLISLVNQNSESIILDFFSGSSTTAHAVMKLNANDGGNRKFIMIQLPEICDDSSEAYKAGYKNICEIGEERIRRAGEKVLEALKKDTKSEGLFAIEETNCKLDVGFKVFKLESTNIRPWDSSIKLDENTIFTQQETIKEGRTKLDVAYEIMLKYGVFNMPLEEVTINNKQMFNVGKGFLIIDLDDNITQQDVEAIGKEKPHCVVFKESGFGTNDNVKLNAVKTLQTFGVEDIKCL